MRARVLTALLQGDERLTEKRFTSDQLILAGTSLTSYSVAVRKSLYAHDFVGEAKPVVIGFQTQAGAIFTVTDDKGQPLQLPHRDPDPKYGLWSGLCLALTRCIDGCGDMDWCEHPRTQELLALANSVAEDFTDRLIVVSGPQRTD